MAAEKVRRPRVEVQKFVDVLQREMPDGTEWLIGGSWARGASDIADLDVLVVLESGSFAGFTFPRSFKNERAGDQIVQGTLWTATTPVEGLSRGTPHVITEASKSIRVDFWVCTPKQRGGFTMFIVGPKALNISHRARAVTMSYVLSQYGLFTRGGMQVDNGTEEDIYRILSLPWLSHEDRQKFVPQVPTASEMEEFETVVYYAKSDRNAGKWYRVTRTIVPDPVVDDVWECECLSWTYSREVPKICKHVARFKRERLRMRYGEAEIIEVHDLDGNLTITITSDLNVGAEIVIEKGSFVISADDELVYVRPERIQSRTSNRTSISAGGDIHISAEGGGVAAAIITPEDLANIGAPSPSKGSIRIAATPGTRIWLWRCVGTRHGPMQGQVCQMTGDTERIVVRGEQS